MSNAPSRRQQPPRQRLKPAASSGLALLLCISLCGCSSFGTQNLGLDTYDIPQGEFAGSGVDADGNPNPTAPPAELAKVSLPTYIIEPPDILLIEGIRMIPKAPYILQPQDFVQIVASGTPNDQLPIGGNFLIEPSGAVNLGPGYGSVKIAGMTTDEAADAIRESLQKTLAAPDVGVSIFRSGGEQIVTGEHLVMPDGTVNLGLYGRVYIAGQTLDEARASIEKHLTQYFDKPQISIDVFALNSKYFYVINEGAGFGQNVSRIQITGNETVLDAIATIGGLDRTTSMKLWISRPTPSGKGCDQVLPVDWRAITAGAQASTNYQLLPGDRLFIAQDRIVAFSNFTSKILDPIERAIGFTLLGTQTIQTAQRFGS